MVKLDVEKSRRGILELLELKGIIPERTEATEKYGSYIYNLVDMNTQITHGRIRRHRCGVETCTMWLNKTPVGKGKSKHIEARFGVSIKSKRQMYDDISKKIMESGLAECIVYEFPGFYPLLICSEHGERFNTFSSNLHGL